MAKQQGSKGSGPSNGTGRKKKVFSESLGVNHLVQLSTQIANSHADKLQQRVEKAKDKQAWEKERNRVKNGGKAKEDVAKAGVKDVAEAAAEKPSPLTKSGHRATLVAKQREKSKMRKDARKAAQKAVVGEARRDAKQSKADITPGRKRVSFA